MASILRQIVAGPRQRHEEAGLDLCYITDNLVVTSGPSATYPSRVYRNPIEDLVSFLDSKHGKNWTIFEFRAEGTGYSDNDVYGRVTHFPWPDHHPPPFALVPKIISGMKKWLEDATPTPEGIDPDVLKPRAVVVHCKAGKGRSGTMACSYLMSEEDWDREKAMEHFTSRRMRPGFGPGISIPSQRRWLRYVERWRDHGKMYIDRQVEVLEVHVQGLRPGVRIAIEGFVESGKKIEVFHIFNKEEREIVTLADRPSQGIAATTMQVQGPKPGDPSQSLGSVPSEGDIDRVPTSSETSDVIFRPSSRVILPSSDINVDCERRTRAGYGWALVTSVAHVWFNCFFEGNGPERCDANQAGGAKEPDDSGVFQIDWNAMDGIKGSSRKGKRSFDRVSVVWKVVSAPISSRPARADLQPVESNSHLRVTDAGEVGAADSQSEVVGMPNHLGLHRESVEGSDVSVMSVESIKQENENDVGHESNVDLTKTHIPQDDVQQVAQRVETR